jgi:hypothetical protein
MYRITVRTSEVNIAFLPNCLKIGFLAKSGGPTSQNAPAASWKRGRKNRRKAGKTPPVFSLSPKAGQYPIKLEKTGIKILRKRGEVCLAK